MVILVATIVLTFFRTQKCIDVQKETGYYLVEPANDLDVMSGQVRTQNGFEYLLFQDGVAPSHPMILSENLGYKRRELAYGKLFPRIAYTKNL